MKTATKWNQTERTTRGSGASKQNEQRLKYYEEFTLFSNARSECGERKMISIEVNQRYYAWIFLMAFGHCSIQTNLERQRHSVANNRRRRNAAE